MKANPLMWVAAWKDEDGNLYHAWENTPQTHDWTPLFQVETAERAIGDGLSDQARPTDAQTIGPD